MSFQFLKVRLVLVRMGVIGVVMALVAAITGPFGSYAAMTFLPRLGFWLLEALISLIIIAASLLVANRLWPGVELTRRLLLAGILNGAVSCLPLGLLYHAVFGYELLGLNGMAELFALNTIFGVAILLIAHLESRPVQLSFRAGGSPDAEPVLDTASTELAPAPSNGTPRLLSRVGPTLRGDLYALQVNDHYVEVRTSSGVESLLLRLSDAIAETDPVPGARVHRSWWVAWDGVAGVNRAGGRLMLVLKDGAVVPVSRSHRQLVEGGIPRCSEAAE